VLDTELKLGQLAEILEVLRLSDHSSLWILDRLQEITEDRVRKLTIALAAVVTSSLVNILGSPEGAVGNINVESQAGAWLTDRRLGLGWVSENFYFYFLFFLETGAGETYVAETNRRINALHRNNDIVKSGSNISLGEE